jgi:hypothetical protein
VQADAAIQDIHRLQFHVAIELLGRDIEGAAGQRRHGAQRLVL